MVVRDPDEGTLDSMIVIEKNNGVTVTNHVSIRRN